MGKWILLVTLQFVYCVSHSKNVLEKCFFSPPDESRPVVWWRWMGSQISKEGITKDLEALKEVGLGGVVHFQISDGINDDSLFVRDNCVIPRVKTLSSEWWNLMSYSISESRRLGLEFRMQNCLGYSTNGGPWIKPEEAMQKLVWSDTIVSIDKNTVLNLLLRKPEVHKKSGYYKDIAVLAVKLNDSGVVPLSDVKDITNFFENGKLCNWKTEAAKWKIIRYGYTPTGVMPHPIDDEVNGLECDKMSREALYTHYSNYVDKIIASAGDNREAIKAVFLDSYEAGAQTWTHKFREKFIEKRGYDPLLWLPTFGDGDIRGSRNSSLGWIPPVGEIIIGNEDLTQRFRYDFMQTIEDLVLEENISAISDLTHRYPNIKFELQPYNAPYDLIRGGKLADIVSGEFWHGNSNYGWWTLPLAASVSHIKREAIVISEAYTASPTQGNWNVLPEDMKAEADLAFSMGVNSLQLHVMPHQPWNDSIFPSMVSQSWGTQINRHNSWWKQSVAWNNYLTCVQSMLRQGETVVDIAYLYPSFGKTLVNVDGYKCDAIDEHTVLESMSADENGLSLDNGRRYKILVLPDTDKMTLKMLKKISNLVENGAHIIGPRPKTSPTLEDYPDGDIIISKLSAKLWGDCDDTKVTEQPFGKGLIHWGNSVGEILEKMGVVKDLEVLKGEEHIVWTHRSTSEEDIYFISNQDRKAIESELVFRVDGKIPEIWDAEKRKICTSDNWKISDGRTKITLPLESLQSVFVVFRKTTDNIEKTRENGKNKESIVDLSIGWNIRFNPVGKDDDFEVLTDSLFDWSLSDDKRIKYFSGTALYSKKVHLSRKEMNKVKHVCMDLGKVGGIASIKINGKDVGVLWKNPYRADITEYINIGDNQIKIEITNTLTNLLIGDEQEVTDMKCSIDDYGGVFRGVRLVEYTDWLYLGKARHSNRKTFTTYNYYKQDSKLMPSGLLDIVNIVLLKN